MGDQTKNQRAKIHGSKSQVWIKQIKPAVQGLSIAILLAGSQRCKWQRFCLLAGSTDGKSAEASEVWDHPPPPLPPAPHPFTAQDCASHTNPFWSLDALSSPWSTWPELTLFFPPSLPSPAPLLARSTERMKPLKLGTDDAACASGPRRLANRDKHYIIPPTRMLPVTTDVLLAHVLGSQSCFGVRRLQDSENHKHFGLFTSFKMSSKM